MFVFLYFLASSFSIVLKIVFDYLEVQVLEMVYFQEYPERIIL